jgi:hypothetical protein
MRHGWKLLAALLATVVLASAASAQTTLRYKYKEGDKLEYVIDQDQKMAMNVLGMDVDMNVNSVMEATYQTMKVDENGSAKIKVTFTRVKMSMKGPMGNVDIDSNDKNEPDDPVGQILAQAVKAMAGLEMTFTVDSLGEVKDTKVAAGALDKLKKIPGADAFGGNMLNADTMKSMLQNNMVLPKEPVQKGDSWSQKMNTKMAMGKISGETKYTYNGETEKNGQTLAKIAVKPNVKIEPDENAKVQVKVKNTSGKGYAFFDNKLGRIAETTNETTMQMQVEAAGQTIDMNIVQNTTMRLKGARKTTEKSQRDKDK